MKDLPSDDEKRALVEDGEKPEAPTQISKDILLVTAFLVEVYEVVDEGGDEEVLLVLPTLKVSIEEEVFDEALKVTLCHNHFEEVTSLFGLKVGFLGLGESVDLGEWFKVGFFLLRVRGNHDEP